MNKKTVSKILLGFSFIMVVLALVFTFQFKSNGGPFFIAFFILLAISFKEFPLLSGLTFTMTILAVVATALTYPQYLISYVGFEFSGLITPLILVIMFGMGC